MSQATHELLVYGVAAAKAGDFQEARNYLERLFNFDPEVDEKIQAWYWLSRISKDPKEKRNLLENILSYNLGDARARRDLAILNGEVKEDEIIDADRYQQQKRPSGQKISSKRFVCPNCGQRMTYRADGRELICEFCNSRDQIAHSHNVGGKNFIAAMATAKGHASPMIVRSLACNGCGAEFILPAEQISFTCPYCNAVYVVENVKSSEIMEPQGIIPFEVVERSAKYLLLEWFKKNDFDRIPKVFPALGIYIPVWIFDLGGQLSWTYKIQESQDEWIKANNSSIILNENNVIIASIKFPKKLYKGISSFDFSRVEPFDRRILADWMAETFQVSLANASLEARKKVLENERPKIIKNIQQTMKDLVVDTSNMVVQSYKLVLIPVWLTRFVDQKKIFYIMINGQNGQVIVQN